MSIALSYERIMLSMMHRKIRHNLWIMTTNRILFYKDGFVMIRYIGSYLAKFCHFIDELKIGE